ncbi:hypothetical protein K503DRAFT_788202 [Rhizopogon vinicolor AM-OR11-026]|uniref:Uncharacterized protein n=1 Tax=Rhizopogon vinicolor AM-OR11-026 TaxID=1314800 RepID=A0A1B7ME29_9AGAM|nr:hypothetical protein K503DRAFT_788202 [Rhizopogon vinicolor AM-OR11-026]
MQDIQHMKNNYNNGQPGGEKELDEQKGERKYAPANVSDAEHMAISVQHAHFHQMHNCRKGFSTSNQPPNEQCFGAGKWGWVIGLEGSQMTQEQGIPQMYGQSVLMHAEETHEDNRTYLAEHVSCTVSTTSQLSNDQYDIVNLYAADTAPARNNCLPFLQHQEKGSMS